MYVCKKCNREVESPKTWLWRRYCPDGHRLLNDAVVRSFWGSFARALTGTFFFTFFAVFAVANNPDFVGTPVQHRRFEQGVGGLFACALVLICLTSVSAFYQAKAWSKRGGAMQKLIPRVRGKGFGRLFAAALLAIFLAPAFW